ncbi:MAG: HisA/HisF-related TIM barrel protein [Thermoanaerobaculum sp.]
MGGNGFRVWAAVDLLGGKAVRLRQGAPKSAWVVSDDPLALAVAWQGQGVQGLHVVDLDAALGMGDNRPLVAAICRTATVPVEVGGGVRGEAAYWQLRELGAQRVVVGSLAVREPEAVARLAAADPEGLVVACDVREGTVVVAGWQEPTPLRLGPFARSMADCGVRHLLVTAVERDGTGLGPDLEVLEEALRAFGPGVVASGGVGSARDLQALVALAPRGLEGVVVGAALASGAITVGQIRSVVGG